MDGLSQNVRYRIARATAHTGWWGAVLLLTMHISMGGSRPEGHSPPWLGLFIVVLIGLGIAGGQSLGRMRLTEAIKNAFNVGYGAAYHDQMDEVAQRQNQILEELEDARKERLNLVRDLQREITESHDEPAR